MLGNQLRQRLSFNELSGLAGKWLPDPVLKRILGRALDGQGLSLCLHRVAPAPRSTDWQVGLSIPPAQLDQLLELLLSARPASAPGWLSVTFDDGYRDAADYIRTRAARFPHVEFIFFICPEKAERQVGFRWDLVEESLKAGRSKVDALPLMSAPVDVDTENARPELRALAKHPDYALCTVEELRALQKLPNVKLGNHTNLHQSSARTPDEVIRRDFEQSTASFERLFGRQEHFAFPFGTPRYHFAPKHVEWLRSMGNFAIWTTEARPYGLSERAHPQPLLPRFPVNGTLSAAALAGWVAGRSLAYRVRGSPHH